MEPANAQYNDVRGAAAADWQGDGKDIHALAQAAGIDTSRYFPVGLSVTGVDLQDLEIFVVDTNGLSGNNFEAVRRHLENSPKSVETIDCQAEILLSSYMKRLEIVLGDRQLTGLI
jgi:hypothetical protein